MASDLFELSGKTYALVVDYYSRFVEVQLLHSTTSAGIIMALKAIFARHGIPATLVTDNGPQYASREMEEFAESYGFQHVTSSPHYPQSNGMAERTVRTVKGLLQDSADPYMALLSYRATPLPWCQLSPAELLMGRRIRTDVPQAKKLLSLDWPYLVEFKRKDAEFKESQKQAYDKRHRVRTLPDLPGDQPVWVESQGRQVPGQVIEAANAPRSYLVETQSGEVRRNRSHLRPRSQDGPQLTGSESSNDTEKRTIATRSRTGTAIRAPDRFSA